MDFNYVHAHNFLTIADAVVHLNARGLVAIEGVNKDDPSATSNGSGKSSIVDAICWCLYGTTARGEGGDDVVNTTVGKDCRVVVAIGDGPTGFSVTRFRKHHTGKNRLEVWQSGTDRTLGTEKETQALIVSMIGASYEVFVASVYAGQEAMPNLPGMTDKQLKLLVEEASGVTVLAEAYTIAKDKHNKAQALLDKEEAGLASLLTYERRLEDQVKNTQAFHDTFEDERKGKARALLAGLGLPMKEIKDAEALIATIDLPELKRLMHSLNEELDSVKPKTAELDRLNGFKSGKYALLKVAKAAVGSSEEKMSRLAHEAKTVSSKVGMGCVACGKIHTPADMSTLIAAADRKMKDQAAVLVAKQTDAEYARIAYELAADEAERFGDAMPDTKKLMERIATTQRALDTYEALTSSVIRNNRHINTVKATARAKLTEDNPHTGILAKTFLDLGVERKQIASTKKIIEECREVVDGLAAACQVFGPAGVRAHILDTVTPFLNDRTKEYLGALSDGTIHATWNTLTKTAKGELREKFSIEVINTKGGGSFGLISGGEKRKVRLACAMALQDLVASRATKPINLFMADEVDEALDDAGLERLMGVLERKAKERGTVLVISHRSLSDWIDQVITVTKEGGLATVSGATGATT